MCTSALYQNLFEMRFFFHRCHRHHLTRSIHLFIRNFIATDDKMLSSTHSSSSHHHLNRISVQFTFSDQRFPLNEYIVYLFTHARASFERLASFTKTFTNAMHTHDFFFLFIHYQSYYSRSYITAEANKLKEERLKTPIKENDVEENAFDRIQRIRHIYTRMYTHTHSKK